MADIRRESGLPGESCISVIKLLNKRLSTVGAHGFSAKLSSLYREETFSSVYISLILEELVLKMRFYIGRKPTERCEMGLSMAKPRALRERFVIIVLRGEKRGYTDEKVSNKGCEQFLILEGNHSIGQKKKNSIHHPSSAIPIL